MGGIDSGIKTLHAEIMTQRKLRMLSPESNVKATISYSAANQRGLT
jgi:hypothetical protein